MKTCSIILAASLLGLVASMKLEMKATEGADADVASQTQVDSESAQTVGGDDWIGATRSSQGVDAYDCPAEGGDRAVDLKLTPNAEGGPWTLSCIKASDYWTTPSQAHIGACTNRLRSDGNWAKADTCIGNGHNDVDCLHFKFKGSDVMKSTKNFSDIPVLCIGCFNIFQIALNPFCIFGPCGGKPMPQVNMWSKYEGGTVEFWWAFTMCIWKPIERTMLAFWTY